MRGFVGVSADRTPRVQCCGSILGIGVMARALAATNCNLPECANCWLFDSPRYLTLGHRELAGRETDYRYETALP